MPEENVAERLASGGYGAEVPAESLNVSYDGYAPEAPARPSSSASAYVAQEEPAPEREYSYAERAAYPDRTRDRLGRQQRAEPEYDRTGDILRYAREQRGETLEDIADDLRIRPTFLASLEACRYEDLPADAYVIGFLRTYATYLGFDGKKAIDHYRREMAGRRRKPQLAMPQPVSESRAPTVAILIAAVAASLLIYGLWYVFATSDRAETSVPPPMPELPMMEQAPIMKPAPTMNMDQAPSSGTVAPSSGSDVIVPSTAAPSTTPNPAPSGDSVSPPVVQQPSPVVVTPPAPAATPTPAPVAAPTPQAEKTSAVEAPKATLAAAESAAPASIGQGGHIVLKALKECWISVADSHGAILFDKTLSPGETYQVPADKTGLRLTIGNVKGLQIAVDGTVLKPLSTDGRVLRGIPLDPVELKTRGVAAADE